MKTKLILSIALVVVVGATVAVILRQQERQGVGSQLPQVMSNYQKTFKLDTSPAIFPDGKAAGASKTNASKP
jgi:hypothetical protein